MTRERQSVILPLSCHAQRPLYSVRYSNRDAANEPGLHGMVIAFNQHWAPIDCWAVVELVQCFLFSPCLPLVAKDTYCTHVFRSEFWEGGRTLKVRKKRDWTDPYVLLNRKANPTVANTKKDKGKRLVASRSSIVVHCPIFSYL